MLDVPELRRNLDALELRFAKLEEQVGEDTGILGSGGSGGNLLDLEPPPPPVITQADNMVRNGDFDRNRNRYVYDTDYAGPNPDPSDVNFEAAHFYRHTAPPVAGQILLEDSTDQDADATPATNSALKHYSYDNPALRHSKWSSSNDEADYDAINGWGRLGANKSIDVPLQENAIFASRRYFFSCICQLEPHVIDAVMTVGSPNLQSTTMDAVAADVGARVKVIGAGAAGADLETTILARIDAQNVTLAANAATAVTNTKAIFGWSNTTGKLRACLWDDTATIRDVITAAVNAFQLEADVVGAPASTDAGTEYLVAAYTDTGEVYITDSVVITAPSHPGAFVSNSVYVYLSWTPIVGVLRYLVLKGSGGLKYQLQTIDGGQTSYIDNGTWEKIVGAYPTGTDRPQAIAGIPDDQFRPNSILLSDKWSAYIFPINVPSTYNRGLTTGKQWLRVWVENWPVRAGWRRALKVDLVQLSTDPGLFARSVLDAFAKRPPSVTATSSSQTGTGTGGGGTGSGTGGVGDRCVAEHTNITVFNRRHQERLLKAGKMRRGLVVLNRNARGAIVSKVEITEPRQVWRIRTRKGKALTASPSERIIRNSFDRVGVRLDSMKPGDEILIYHKGQYIVDRVKEVFALKRKQRVVKISVASLDHTYIANGIVVHNVKPIEGIA